MGNRYVSFFKLNNFLLDKIDKIYVILPNTDGTPLALNSKLYFIWSGWEGDKNILQKLYIAEMENPWTILGERYEISKPELPWELIGEPFVNEGPEVLIKNGTVHIIYSAR